MFALVDLPETVKGAMFARYSRYPGTLRRLFLDEFADSLPERAAAAGRATSRARRAAELFERIFVGYGDDSVAQLGGAHIAVEWVSNVLTKVLQRPRLAAYLEQSTRYIAYDAPMPGGGYRYYRDAALGPEYAAAMDALFGAYSEALPRVARLGGLDLPGHARRVRGGPPPRGQGQGAGPAARAAARRVAVAHGHLRHRPGLRAADPAPARAPAARGARRAGKQMLEAVKAVIPSFVARVERPGRGDVWVDYLSERRAAERRWTERLGLDRDDERRAALLGRAGRTSTATRTGCSPRCCSRPPATPRSARWPRSPRSAIDERARMLADLVGERANRRHRPGRGFEALRYRFEIVSDYGAFRDLQRHRMLTVQWQPLTPDLGAEIPEEVVEAGCGDLYERALDRSRAEYERLRAAGHAEAAPYALCLGYRIRYILDLNAREAMHLTELRSAREGHASYRAVAQAMHTAIAERHPAVAATMKYVDHSSEPRLERILSEIRGESRRAQITA